MIIKRIINKLFKKKQIIDSQPILNAWKYLTDNDQWHFRTNKQTGETIFWYKGEATKVVNNKLWVNLN